MTDALNAAIHLINAYRAVVNDEQAKEVAELEAAFVAAVSRPLRQSQGE